MATDEEIDRFVTENKELIERMMIAQNETIRLMADVNKELAEEALKKTKESAEEARMKSELFFKATMETITSPVVQKHFMNASMEFLAGLTAMIEIAPIPDCVKTSAGEFEKNMKRAACKANTDCPAKEQKVEIPAEPAAE